MCTFVNKKTREMVTCHYPVALDHFNSIKGKHLHFLFSSLPFDCTIASSLKTKENKQLNTNWNHRWFRWHLCLLFHRFTFHANNINNWWTHKRSTNRCSQIVYFYFHFHFHSFICVCVTRVSCFFVNLSLFAFSTHRWLLPV